MMLTLLAALGGAAQPAPVLRGSSFKENVATATSITVNLPTGTQAGDLLVCQLSSKSSSAAWTATGGWTIPSSSNGSGIGLAYKNASSSDVSAGSVTLGVSVNENHAANLLAFAVGVWDTSGTVASGSGGTVTASAITVGAGNSMLLMFTAAGSASKTFAAPAGMTTVNTDANANVPSSGVFSQSGVGAGSSGTKTSTYGTGGSVAVLASIKGI